MYKIKILFEYSIPTNIPIKTMSAKLIKSTGEELEVKPQNGKSFSVEELQKLVGGYFEFLSCSLPNTIMVCNEEGKLSHLNLLLNQKAT